MRNGDRNLWHWFQDFLTLRKTMPNKLCGGRLKRGAMDGCWQKRREPSYRRLEYRKLLAVSPELRMRRPGLRPRLVFQWRPSSPPNAFFINRTSVPFV